MALAHVSLGSNIGDREGALGAAVERLREAMTVIAVSSLYETDPKEFVAQPSFLNAVVAVETEMSPQLLMRVLLEIERSLGRVRSADAPAKGPRKIDLDLLLYRNECGDVYSDEPGLHLPHPRMQERLFVLEPLAEIAGEVVHPLLNVTVRELRDRVAKKESAESVRRVEGGSAWAEWRG